MQHNAAGFLITSVCDRLLLIHLLQPKMLQAVRSHDFLTSDPLALSPFYLK